MIDRTSTCQPEPRNRTSYPTDSTGHYRYTQDLRLRSMSTTPSSAGLPKLTSISTPLRYEAWEERLRQHPYREFTSLILQGIQSGFHIGVPAAALLESAHSNMPSCKAHAEVVSNYLAKETKEARAYSRPPFAPHPTINR